MALEIDIPGWRRLHLKHLVLDLNGTLALDGKPLPGVARAVERAAGLLKCHLLTADTFGTAAGLFGQNVALAPVRPGREGDQKQAFVEDLGAETCLAFGNGANDAGMLAVAGLGICVAGPEGAAVAAMVAADVLVTDVLAGFGLVFNPNRLKATLRR